MAKIYLCLSVNFFKKTGHFVHWRQEQEVKIWSKSIWSIST